MRSFRGAEHFAGLETQIDLLFDKKRDFSDFHFLWGRCIALIGPFFFVLFFRVPICSGTKFFGYQFVRVPNRALIGPYRAL